MDVKLVLTQFKIGNKFSYKDPLPFHLHSSFANLFVQTVSFAMCVKSQCTSSPESMNTYRNIHVYVIVSAIRIVFQ